MRKQDSWKPKFLADQNIGLKTISFLRELGFDVMSLQEAGLRGKPDEEVVDTAKSEGRIILTFDKDFGEIYYFSERGRITVLIIYADDQTSENVNSILQQFLHNTDLREIRNKLAILYKNRVRIIGS